MALRPALQFWLVWRGWLMLCKSHWAPRSVLLASCVVYRLIGSCLATWTSLLGCRDIWLPSVPQVTITADIMGMWPRSAADSRGQEAAAWGSMSYSVRR